MSEAPHTPNTSAFEPEKESKASPVKRFAPLAGIVALMGTIVVAGSAIANTRTAPEIDPSAVTVEPSISKEHSDHQGPSTPVTPSSERDDDSDDVDDVSDDIQQEPAYITPQVPLTYQDWDDDDDDWDDDDWDDDDDDWGDDDWDDDWDDDDDDD